jgi:hypothetical protein
MAIAENSGISHPHLFTICYLLFAIAAKRRWYVICLIRAQCCHEPFASSSSFWSFPAWALRMR